MAELPGWDRDRLRTAEPADVEAARTIAYGRAWRPFLAIDFEAQIYELETAGEKVNPVQVRSRRRERAAVLRRQQKIQAEMRKLLELDVVDEEEDDDRARVN
jgi:hypothetical protein